MRRSDSPPVLPGTQAEYPSAVSTKLPPPALKASRMSKDVFRSAVQPKTLPPRLRGKTDRSEVPRAARECIMMGLLEVVYEFGVLSQPDRREKGFR
jgi:hypothetical protein